MNYTPPLFITEQEAILENDRDFFRCDCYISASETHCDKRSCFCLILRLWRYRAVKETYLVVFYRT